MGGFSNCHFHRLLHEIHKFSALNLWPSISFAAALLHNSMGRLYPMTDATDFKESLKQQADIVRIVGDYVKLRKAGAQNYSGLCPFHNEKTPSFSVHATRQFFHCFGCGVSGDVFAFFQKFPHTTFPPPLRLTPHTPAP